MGSYRLPLKIHPSPPLDAWEIPRGNLILEGDNLGRGCFSKVYRGVVKGPIVTSKTMKKSICRTVAIKLLKGELSQTATVITFWLSVFLSLVEYFFCFCIPDASLLMELICQSFLQLLQNTQRKLIS